MSTLLEQFRAGEPLTGLDIVDFHGHLGRPNFAVPDTSPASLVASMDRIGIARIAVSHIQCIGWDPLAGNEAVRQAMAAHPGRFIGLAVFWPTDADDVRAEAERWFAAGFDGMKFHNIIGHPYDHPAYEGAYAFADEKRLPALFHCWGGKDELAQVDAVAANHPEMTVLAAHAGSTNEAGYIQLAQSRKNVTLDLAFSRSGPGLVERLVAAVGAERITFGSDALFFAQTQQIGKVVGADLPDADKRRILSTNAQEILARIRR